MSAATTNLRQVVTWLSKCRRELNEEASKRIEAPWGVTLAQIAADAGKLARRVKTVADAEEREVSDG